MREIAYWQALNEALQEEMERDPNVFLLGEDIGVYGGAYGVTRGLLEKYGPERVMDTAISESAITGAAIGAAMMGKRPVAEIMYVDFMGQAMDQLCNQAAKIRYMFGGKFKAPMVMRTEGGAGRTLGAHHSQSLEHWFTGIPGLKVVMPSTPADAKGLLKASIRDDNPVVFIEHKMLYKEKGPVPDGDHVVPLGVADVKRQGKDVTVVSYSRTVLVALEAAKILEAEGIDVEVIDVRTLAPLDIKTIVDSVKKTNRAVVAHEACKTGGFGGEIGMQIIENAFDYLDGPVKRVAAIDVPIPKSPVLEQYVIPTKDSIIKAVKEALA
ncbi:alpha-ketoacid dehydrogenase subunit beta [Candidatus Desantisbacteria bacterium CG_4_10_14_0_8_um_filter_48_22]|uniref:Alpha-ketoacid dehydrogenase subunit beta n=1 Tax=Candidatus Desantisbacteria bacterium CG_4_10_14_0_8_um_filter_48_22 TaxID=1974543 RepID=A0A2M7SC13_9BACT|nr:MAG: alpha-ketoacid dehydrogenase subunit beta [Candidatus Desantisbacteria bacterium CG1_02_49_89]PIV54759.1 MAG: alpha-ketoacid dehydrogenase subunit beta [Candidatus Desantisbacteria bacterium CG02_land_8_20_14_3_00_49_13]PIZ17000.1 MAG: alpha-ketoacid dehydrogenase subunit beta [Candidatus Desantisbacteria bacterium CG_4_10_14_0_8_um_filter_48_22]